MRNTIYTFLVAMALLAVQPSWASEGYGSAWNTTTAATSTVCPAPQPSTETPDDPPAPQNVVEYGAGG